MSFNPWTLPGVDLYALVRPLFFLLDPECAHDLTIKTLSWGLGSRQTASLDSVLKTKLFGLDFENPVGLAAGLDKQATAIDGVLNLGFGFAEIGGVTPRPQPGNPRPRLFRIPEAEAIINRFGFNSVGADVFAERLAAWRAKPSRVKRPVGVNLGKNKDTVEDDVDYVACLRKVAAYADFVTINVSSPNTAGLRNLQGAERLSRIIASVMQARAEVAPTLPVLVKIAPDLDDTQIDEIADVVLKSGAQGMITSNTTIARPDTLPPQMAKEAGGLSGKPLFAPSTALLKRVYRTTKGALPLIGSGGIASGADAYAKIRAGASLIQIYSALIYRGPGIVPKINRDLASLLKRDGFASVADAVGVDAR